MDGLRLSLLIVGLAVVAGIVVFTWLRRRRASPRRDGLGPISDEPGLEPGGFLDVPEVAGAEFDSADIPVEDIGGVFVPLRDDSGKELSVDVSILAGLRATYESTVGGDSIAAQDSGTDVAPETLAPAPEASESMHDAPSFEREDVAEAPEAEDAEPLVIDMSRPMIYLMLIARERSVSGRAILESLDAGGFRPGALQLYYWQSESEPAVVFGVASLVEPGVLDPESLLETETPGLVTFMSVSQDMSLAVKTFNAMVDVSRHLARKIDARVCDETQSTLTAQAENHLREKIADILRRDWI